ncbi:MAG: anthranilate phosphoribosyltransferase, partial [Thiotrichales bacterium]|nr:anthranilate phosphoribosyltransferase [Thiotrichales bacterium]
GAFLSTLVMKGERPEEIVGFARAMRENSVKLPGSIGETFDTCGTGGDGLGLFNISTASAFVVAAAGGKVAKHGNRSISSKSGSADVLESAGVNLNLSPSLISECIAQIGVGFMFAPAHHSAMKHAIGPRKELAVRTIFNVLGPLTNPAKAPNQIMGVYDKNLVEPIANVLKGLGSRHVMVIHSDDGLDEFSIADKTYVAELKDGVVSTYSVHPEDFGLTLGDLKDIRADNADASLALITEAFSGRNGTAKNIISLNAGAAIYVSGLTTSLQSGIDRANQVLSDGSSQKKLDEYIKISNS